MFHKEGFNFITITAIIVVAGILLAESFFETYLFQKIAQISLLIILLLVLQYFRNPRRNTLINKNHIIAPVDGKIVFLKEVFEPNYYKENRLLISISVSVFNVHVSRYPISGLVKYSKNLLNNTTQKSSSKNKRTSIIINNSSFNDIMYEEISKSFAKRIVNYALESNNVVQGEDAGFINMGSRINLFLPLKSKLHVQLGDKVKGGEQIIASK